MNSDVRFYRDLLLRRLPLVALITGVFTALGLAAALMMTPTFRAEALLVMESPQIPDELAVSTVSTGATEQLQIIEQRMLTRAHLLDIANRYGLYQGGGIDPSLIVAGMRGRTTIEIDDGRDQATTMRIAFEASDPNIAAEVTNAYVTFMLEENITLRTNIAAQTVDFFQIEMQRLSEELERRSARISEFKLANSDALPENLPFLRETQGGRQTRLTELARERAQIGSQRADFVLEYEATGRVEVIIEDRYTPFLTRLSALQEELETALVVDGEQGSRVVGLRGRIASVERSINAQLAAEGFAPTGGAGAVFERQLATIDERLAEIDSETALITEELSGLNDQLQVALGNAITLDTLERDHATTREQYAMAMSRAATAQTGDLIEALSKGQRITVIEQAVAPNRPYKPNRRLIMAGGVAFGLMLSLGTIFLLEMLNQTLRRPSDLTARLGITPFATIPFMPTPGEATARRVRGGALALALAGGIPAALYAVHVFYLPLDLILTQLLARFGIAG
jgi:uncharacterized protein involved in exopolysaccharide biosynthesis